MKTVPKRCLFVFYKMCFKMDCSFLINHKCHLPVLARLLPKLKTVPVVVAVPKHPTLKLTPAGLALKPNPPKLNPPAVVLPAPSPPNPSANGSRQQKGESKKIEMNGKNISRCGLKSLQDTAQRDKTTTTKRFICRFLPVLVEPKLNPVAGAAALVVAVPNAGAVRAAWQNQRQTRNKSKRPDQINLLK